MKKQNKTLLFKIAFLLFSCVFSQLYSYAQIITTFAGNGAASYTGGGSAITTGIGYPGSCAFDNQGNFYFGGGGGGYYGDRIFKVTPCGVISVVAGVAVCGYNGDGIVATMAQLNGPVGIAFDTHNNLYIADDLNNRVRKIDAITGLITTIAGTGIAGYSGDGGSAAAAMINEPCNICFDRIGNLFIADQGNHKIRKVDTFGIISTYAGTGIGGYIGDGGRADTAEIENLYGICADGVGNIFFIQQYDAVIRKIDTAGIITTIAGNGIGGDVGDGGAAIDAELDPFGLAIDSLDNLYITGFLENNVRKINDSGIIYNVAGTGVSGFSGDGGEADSAELNYVYGIAVDPSGNIYFADVNNRRIRKVTFNPPIIPTITLTTYTSDTVCAGTPIAVLATVTGDTIPVYQWFLNGISVVDTTNIYTYVPTNGDSVVCKLFTSDLCTVPTSNTIHMIVNGVVPTISISASSADTVCAGASVSYTATVMGAGSNSYTWYVNGASVSTTTDSIYTYTPATGDHITCKATGTNMCNGSADTLVGNTITMLVDPVITPSISITSSITDTICAGTSVTFTTTSSGGGPAPLYQWIRNGIPVATGISYTYLPTNGDSVRCLLTGSSACTMPATAGSNTITMLVNPVVTPSVSITFSTTDTICAGTLVIFTATSSGGGTAPLYQWVKNGSLIDTGISFTYIPANGDSVRCLLTGSSPCTIPASVSSNTLTLYVDTLSAPSIAISGPASVGGGSSFTLTATVADAGSSYSIQWYHDGTLFATTATPTVTCTIPTGPHTFFAQLVQQSFHCNDSAVSGAITVFGTDGIATVTAPYYSIYPNPAQNEVTITGSNIASITLANTLGQTLLNTTTNTEKITISIAALPPGIYIITTTATNGQRTITKIIKQ